ncbi:hypothetical protein J1614_007986 [Plenodomus biglobosus]|nr:hypothetical protein J1614_007986 [Plenodomus biglobosus]
MDGAPVGRSSALAPSAPPQRLAAPSPQHDQLDLLHIGLSDNRQYASRREILTAPAPAHAHAHAHGALATTLSHLL